ncbi:cell wall mannoprotein 1 family protein [Aspergillus lucknowensis]|uniref:Hydrophobic surface binding protein A-domain-containing protein n=1 Tax=Aspergillus lucknowensis TaxID=176173 RepID=A0ABR4LXL5_9EURO
MKFSGLITLALATAALATPAKRQSSPADIIETISEQVTALDSAVDSYSGGDPADVQSASDKLVSTINSAVDEVNAGPDLSNSDALALTGPVQDLTDQVEGVVGKLIDKKDQFVEAGAGGDVKESLNQQYDAATSLADAISSKVPAALEDIASELSAGISNAIQKGIDAYADVEDGGDGPAPTTTTEPSEPTQTTEPTEPTGTTSTPVIPTPTLPTTTGTPTSTPTGTPAPPDFTGAASKERFSLVGGALAAVAVAVAI